MSCVVRRGSYCLMGEQIFKLFHKSLEFSEIMCNFAPEKSNNIIFAELLYGAECSKNIERNKKEVYSFCNDIKMLAIDDVIEEYARQKAILRKNGTPIDDMDIFIGCTAVVNDCVMVTENVKHLNKLENIAIENWVDKI